MNDERHLSKDTKTKALDATCDHTDCDDKGTYTLSAVCWNCGWKGTVTQTKGHKAYTFECPNCECNEVRASS